MASPHDLLSALARAYALTEIPSEGTPEFSRALRKVQEAQEELGWLVVQVGEDGFIAGGQAVADPIGEYRDLRNALDEAGLKEIRFQEALSFEALEGFLGRLRPSVGPEDDLPSARFRGLEGELGLSFRAARTALPGMSGGIQELFRDRPPATGMSGGEGVEPDPKSPGPDTEAPVADPETPDPVPETPVPVPAPALSLPEEAEAFLRGVGPDREEAREKLRERVRGLEMARDVPALSALVERLVEGGLEGSGDDQEDQDALGMAREIATPAVAAHVVACLGSSRDEVARARLTRVTSAIGEEGALALADALGESRDRFERRSYMTAMVALGPRGLEMAQKMVEDSRWFVVRNGVALLGNLGGEDAVAYLAATLANEDGRVRQETVMSLAKVGGRNAEMLVLGMLNDGDAEVRAKACRALGILKPPRSFKPLLPLVNDDSLDVQVECLQALGRIGDLSAIQHIEKKAVGGLVTRPSREVRIAAFRALAAIGTPGARKALRRGLKDRDDGVRTVVGTLISKR